MACSDGRLVFEPCRRAVWGEAVARGGSAGDLAAARVVYEQAVAAGVWRYASQRPERLVNGLEAAPWHQPYAHAACVALRDAYAVIKHEACVLN